MMLGIDFLSYLRRRGVGTSRYRLKRTMAHMRFRCSAAREELGWEPRVPLAEGLSLVLAALEEGPYPH